MLNSYTTRPKRTPDEVGHTFVSTEEFNKLVNLVGYTKFNGYEYCATQEQVNNSDVYVIDPAGVEYFLKTYCGDRRFEIVYIYASESCCYRRMVYPPGYIPRQVLKKGDIYHEF